MVVTENRIFRYALGTSIALHVFVLVLFWITNIQYEKDNTKKEIEVVYRAQSQKENQLSEDLQPISSLKPKRKISVPNLLLPSDSEQPGPAQQLEKQPMKLDIPQKTMTHLKEFEGKRQIKIPMLNSDKMMGTRYMTYHEQIRDKIRNRAYFYVDDPNFESGQVYLTFVLASNGDLEQVKIIHEKTHANSYLQSVGLRSIKESAPFPPFPKDLNYPELTFNVIISFEVGN